MGASDNINFPLAAKYEVPHTSHRCPAPRFSGGSGMTTTHAIVMAQMSIGNKSYGMHPFLVPMREPETHKLLPGVFAMDMGPKVGAPAMDNGYITFQRVSIPRENLLGRFQHVHRDGTYETRNQAAKALTRGAMVSSSPLLNRHVEI